MRVSRTYFKLSDFFMLVIRQSKFFIEELHWSLGVFFESIQILDLISTFRFLSILNLEWQPTTLISTQRPLI